MVKLSAIAAVGCCFRYVMRFSLGRAITAVCRLHRCHAFNLVDKSDLSTTDSNRLSLF